MDADIFRRFTDRVVWNLTLTALGMILENSPDGEPIDHLAGIPLAELENGAIPVPAHCVNWNKGTPMRWPQRESARAEWRGALSHPELWDMRGAQRPPQMLYQTLFHERYVEDWARDEDIYLGVASGS